MIAAQPDNERAEQTGLPIVTEVMDARALDVLLDVADGLRAGAYVLREGNQ